MNIVESQFQELYGVICWQVRWDGNLNLSMNFGQPSLRIREPTKVKQRPDRPRWSDSFKYRHVTPRGEWYFWVMSSYWRLSIKDFDEVTSATTYKRKNMALVRMDGQKLIRASVNPATSATQLDFDLGAKLSIRRMGIENDGDIWSLYKPNGYVLSIRADGKYCDDPDNTKITKQEWKPIVTL